MRQFAVNSIQLAPGETTRGFAVGGPMPKFLPRQYATFHVPRALRSAVATEVKFPPLHTSKGCNVWRGKGVPGQSTTLHIRGRRVAPTALRCSVLQLAAELASLTSFAALRQWRRVSPRSALARAAASPVLLGAAQARRGLPGRAFAEPTVVCVDGNEREEPSRQAVPAGGDLWSDEKHSPTVDARSAQRELTRRSCLSAVSEANEASSATRLWGEHRSAVGATRRPRKHEPPAGTAWRDAKTLDRKMGIAWGGAKALGRKTRQLNRNPVAGTSIAAEARHASRVAPGAVEQLK